MSLCVVTFMLFAGSAAFAQQIIPPGGSMLNPLLPAAPPPPKIEVPVIPQLDAAPPQPSVQPLARGGSFSDRITQCLDEAAAGGLGPNERAAYSRMCANER